MKALLELIDICGANIFNFALKVWISIEDIQGLVSSLWVILASYFSTKLLLLDEVSAEIQWKPRKCYFPKCCKCLNN